MYLVKTEFAVSTGRRLYFVLASPDDWPYESLSIGRFNPNAVEFD